MIEIQPYQHRVLESIVAKLSEEIGFGSYQPFTPQDVLIELQYGRRLGLRNIVGFGYGMKIVKKQLVDQIAITGYVVRKVPSNHIENGFEIHQYIRSLVSELPSDVGIDVMEVGNPRVYQSNSVVYNRRIPGGAGIANTVLGMEGTLGGWVRISPSDEVMLLSCWHILDGGQARVGISSVSQPRGGNTIATLMASVEPVYVRGLPTVDAALAKLSDQWQDAHGDFLLRIGEVRGVTDIKSKSSVRWPIHVRIYGIKSHLSTGAIINSSVNLSISNPTLTTGRSRPYGHQLLVYPDVPNQPFALPGDSGALIVTDDNLVIGLLVAGIPYNGCGIATPISSVLSSLGRQLNNSSIEFLTYP